MTIAGRDFTGVSDVSFGSVPASSFVVDSEGEITAVAPPQTDAGPVDVTVTNASGTSGEVPQDRFTYVAPAAPTPPGPAPTSRPAASPRSGRVAALSRRLSPASGPRL